MRIANRIDEVLPVLDFAERAAQSGSHVAVMLSYEAAPAFDPALITHEPSQFPLAWARVFADPEHVASEEYPPCPNFWTPAVGRDEYDHAVARIGELIAAGDTYQVNYSFPLTSEFNGDPYAWYQNLFVAQGAQYSVYLDLGRYKVLCLSPELFFHRTGDSVVMRPMKGTLRRGR